MVYESESEILLSDVIRASLRRMHAEAETIRAAHRRAFKRTDIGDEPLLKALEHCIAGLKWMDDILAR